VNMVPRVAIEQALKDLKVENLQSWVQWLSAYPSRYNRLSDPNKHVFALVDRLKQVTSRSRMPVQIEMVDHQSTKQKSIRLTIQGSQRPQEVVVFGAHLDSISSGDRAPGADDNASGSANLLETLRVVMTQDRPQRTLEFYWYAGEESGLLGSAEIAKAAKAAKRNVVAVLQLDMTLFPGEGEFVIGSMTDYTSAWLRDYLNSVNDTYLKIKIREGQCGYGCSDHASWYRQGYPTLMPFEARMNSMNRALHTPNDVVSGKLNFNHSLVFSKIALVMAMDLANSDIQQPFR
jgi:bacterial leucyl aminopeptidase